MLIEHICRTCFEKGRACIGFAQWQTYLFRRCKKPADDPLSLLDRAYFGALNID